MSAHCISRGGRFWYLKPNTRFQGEEIGTTAASFVMYLNGNLLSSERYRMKHRYG